MLGVVELMEIEVKLLLVLKYFGVSINGDGENCKFYKGVGEIIIGDEYCGVDESEGEIAITMDTVKLKIAMMI